MFYCVCDRQRYFHIIIFGVRAISPLLLNTQGQPKSHIKRLECVVWCSTCNIKGF
nr:MAG TPA: hypothetical protein [Caudoviricetes sp.]